MGNRGNIVVREENGNDIYFYTHWRGSLVPTVVQRALAHKERWDDEPYLARILFCELVKDHEGGLDGYGISTGLCDNEHPILVVQPSQQRVGMAPRPPWDAKDWKLEPDKWWTFDEFIQVKLGDEYAGWDALAANVRP